MRTIMRQRPTVGVVTLMVLGLMMYVGERQATQAKPSFTLVKNVDERGREPYQVQALVNTSTCTFNSVLYFCQLPFPAVPDGQRLILEHVTTFWALTAGEPDSLRFLDSNNATVFWVQPTFTPRVNNATHFFLDRPVTVYYEPTTSPTLLLAMTAPPSSIEVTLTGYLISATN